MEDGNGPRSMWNEASAAVNRAVMRNTAEDIDLQAYTPYSENESSQSPRWRNDNVVFYIRNSHRQKYVTCGVRGRRQNEHWRWVEFSDLLKASKLFSGGPDWDSFKVCLCPALSDIWSLTAIYGQLGIFYDQDIKFSVVIFPLWSCFMPLLISCFYVEILCLLLCFPGVVILCLFVVILCVFEVVLFSLSLFMEFIQPHPLTHSHSFKFELEFKHLCTFTKTICNVFLSSRQTLVFSLCSSVRKQILDFEMNSYFWCTSTEAGRLSDIMKTLWRDEQLKHKQEDGVMWPTDSPQRQEIIH